MTRLTVAALFVDPNGTYPTLDNIDCWDIDRDARLYAGPHPVIAHPPCQLWVNFAALNFKRYGGEHNRPGNDKGCFKAALTAIRTWGACSNIQQAQTPFLLTISDDQRESAGLAMVVNGHVRYGNLLTAIKRANEHGFIM